jgi:OmpA-OmpF porin, OOP family
MKKFGLVFSMFFSCYLLQAQGTSDTEWSKNFVSLKNCSEGEYLIRVGDVDNLGFGWTEGFNPFKGGQTDAHNYPWDVNPQDLPGMDRILLPSSYKGVSSPCGGDGYSNSYNEVLTKPQIISIPLDGIKNATINDAKLQIFIDDFQAPVHCTRFNARLNGIEFKELNTILNNVNQTGPIGKLVSVKIPAYILPELKKEKLNIYIDDPYTSAADGFAIDFIRLIINPKVSYAANIKGKVSNCASNTPLKAANIDIEGFGNYSSGADGSFDIKNVPAGYYVVKVSAPKLQSQYQLIDVVADKETEEMEFCLKEPVVLNFNGKKFNDDEQVNLNLIQFASASAELKPESYKGLDALVLFMQENADITIELSGFTSSEGDEQTNINLSLQRVNKCKEYLVGKGIGEERIIAIGMGPADPIAPNDTEEGRNKNRRVEFGIKRK